MVLPATVGVFPQRGLKAVDPCESFIFGGVRVCANHMCLLTGCPSFGNVAVFDQIPANGLLFRAKLCSSVVCTRRSSLLGSVTAVVMRVIRRRHVDIATRVDSSSSTAQQWCILADSAAHSKSCCVVSCSIWHSGHFGSSPCLVYTFRVFVGAHL